MLVPATNRRAFLSVVLAQFLSSLADNALLIAAIGLLAERRAAGWMAPALRICFYLAYVVLGAFAGAVADAFAKSRVIAATNFIKLGGCALLLAGLHPLLAYALVGLGASAYSPAKYGILPELLPATELVLGNAWIEVSTVISILIGVMLGGVLIDPRHLMASMGTPAVSATAWIFIIYVFASLAALSIPRGVASNRAALSQPGRLLSGFVSTSFTLWRDRTAGQSIAVTSLFWAVASALQFLVLRWAAEVLQLPLSQAALLQGALALGIIAGAALAARFVPLRRGMALMPAGLAIGALVMGMLFVSSPLAGFAMLATIGLLSGVLLVPMNAILQSRGRSLMHPGQAIAVQNFFENAASLLVLWTYGALTYWGTPLSVTIAGLGMLISCATLAMLLGRRRELIGQ